MADYRLKNELEHEIIHVNPKTFQASNIPQHMFNLEAFDFKLPSFAKLQEMQQACTIPLFGTVDDRALDMLILKNCLKSCSFFKIELKDDVIDQKCFDEMTGAEGVPPSILAYVVRVIRARL
jgi:hypothetical protein